MDDDTADYYHMKPGKLGEELAASMFSDEEGSHFMMTEDMRCPFLRDDGLCRIVLAYGEEALCDVCALHPRFFFEYGEYELCGLGLSCERVCELLWETDEPLGFTDEGFHFTGQQRSYRPDIDRESLEELFLLYQDTEPIDEVWDIEMAELLSDIDRVYEAACAYAEVYDTGRYDRLYHYILYRQLEKADTEDIYLFAKRAMDFIFVTDAYSGDVRERIRRFSEQIEYSEENTKKLYDHT